MGAEPSRAAHHPEIGNNLVPYNVVNHRHTYEMEQELSELAGEKVTVHFTPTYVPTIRGILAICHTQYINRVDRAEVLSLYREFYKNQPFIKIYDLPREVSASWQYRPYPWVSSVAGTNYCFIGLDVDEVRQRIVIFSVLDNLGKGGAQCGVENMNLMLGLDRRAGLTAWGCILRLLICAYASLRICAFTELLSPVGSDHRAACNLFSPRGFSAQISTRARLFPSSVYFLITLP